MPAHRIEFRKSRIGPNAFALPGGSIVITDELVALVDGDAAVVTGVLGHELGHVRHRDGMRMLLQASAVGVLASNPLHLGGAIDADAADKAARFMRLCDLHGLPMVSLIDTPGFMVGPDIEARAQVRHVSRMFVAAAQLRVPFLAIVIRKAYGLGAMAMAAGGFHAPLPGN